MKNITAFGRHYHKTLGTVIPGYAILSLIACFGFNNLIYFGIQRLMTDATYYNLSLPLDRMIPLQSGWISVYWFCYIFWGISYVGISRLDKQSWFQYVTADLLSRVICGIFFLALPTTIVRPEVTGGDVWAQGTRVLYQLDPPTNLFPSIHCLISWFCYLGIHKKQTIPRWVQLMSFLYCILVFASVLFTRQHVIADIIGGVALAQGCYFLTTHTEIYRPVMKFFDQITGIILGDDYE